MRLFVKRKSKNNLHMRFISKQTKCIQHVTGTVRIKEFNKQRLYNKQEVIPYYNFFKVEILKF